jgi:hypothetical protein
MLAPFLWKKLNVKFLLAATRRPLILKENLSETLFRELVAAFRNEAARDSKLLRKPPVFLKLFRKPPVILEFVPKAACGPGNCSESLL